MSRQRYPEGFKIEAVKQVPEKGKPVAEVAQRLGMSLHSLYAWIKVYIGRVVAAPTKTWRPLLRYKPKGSSSQTARSC